MSRDSVKLGLDNGGGGSNAGAPTLTTPTLTPTTLRNIEQMFADRDPHEPPPAHVNAAGFVPPIISPSAGSTYISLLSSVSGLTSGLSTPSSEVAGVSLPDLISPSLAEIIPIPDITNGRANGNNKIPKPPLLIQNITSPLPVSSSTVSSSLSSPPSLPALVQKITSLPPEKLAALQSPVPPLVLKSSNAISQPADLTISVRPQNLAEKKERPPSLNLGPIINGNVINKKMERLDNILKSVATSSTKVSVASAVVLPSGDTKAGGIIKQEPLTVEVTSESAKERARSLSGPSRKPSLAAHQPSWEHDDGGPQEGEEDRRKQRRERNKEAAARCRKRRLDLTCTLQTEVDQWEDKVKSLKEELSQLETQKKGLESILRKCNSGKCKVVKEEGDK